MLLWITFTQSHIVIPSSHASKLSPPVVAYCTHKHKASACMHIIMQGGVPGLLHYAWGSGEPDQWSVSKRNRSEQRCWTHVSAVTPPLSGPQTYARTQ